MSEEKPIEEGLFLVQTGSDHISLVKINDGVVYSYFEPDNFELLENCSLIVGWRKVDLELVLEITAKELCVLVKKESNINLFWEQIAAEVNRGLKRHERGEAEL